MAADNWKAFPYDQSAYDYPGDKLKKLAAPDPRLRRSLSGRRLGGEHGDRPSGCPGKDREGRHRLHRQAGRGRAICGAPAGCLAPAVPQRPPKAKEQGLALGVGGQVPAMFASALRHVPGSRPGGLAPARRGHRLHRTGRPLRSGRYRRPVRQRLRQGAHGRGAIGTGSAQARLYQRDTQGTGRPPGQATQPAVRPGALRRLRAG